MDRHIHQSAVTVSADLRETANRCGVQLPYVERKQATVPLGDQHVPVGEKRQRPGVRQPPGHDAHPDLVLFSGVDDPGTGPKGRYWYADILRGRHGGGSQEQE